MSRAFETRTSSLIIGAVIAAGLTSLALMGNYTYFGTSAMGLRNGIDWMAIPVCGVVGGLAGGLFSRILIMMAQGFSNPVGRAIKRYPVGFAAVCGLAAAICSLASDGAIYGTGYSQVKAALEGGAPLSSSFSVLKFLATTFSSISGMPGGIFSPRSRWAQGSAPTSRRCFTVRRWPRSCCSAWFHISQASFRPPLPPS